MANTARYSRPLIALFGLLLLGGPASASDEVDPKALNALEQMGRYLRSLQQFQLSAQSRTDQVLESGQVVEFSHHTELLAQPPDKLQVTVDSQGQQRSLYYDGDSFTLYQRRSGYFARAPAPPSIHQLLDRLSERYGIELPLADLFRWDTGTAQQVGIRSALSIGSDTLNGQRCTHYAYRQADIDWQLWLREGPQPLPCRLVISRRDVPEQPRHSLDFQWQPKGPIAAQRFVFVPPAGAREVPLQQLQPRQEEAP